MRRKHGHSLHDFIVRELGQQILSGRLPVGKPIPADTTLCSTLHISRTALREALIALAAKGLVQARQKVGTVVCPREAWNMLDLDILTWRVESEEGDEVIAELYELRKLIEPLAASLAASHATRRDLEPIQRAYEEMVAAGDDGNRVLDPDVRFHRGIIAASGNSLFASVGLLIATALEVNFKIIRESPRGHAWALPLHKAILEGITARDPNKARVSMQNLLTESEKDLRTFRTPHLTPQPPSPEGRGGQTIPLDPSPKGRGAGVRE
jgi:DNA-binding FadR family transcriptional regulator